MRTKVVVGGRMSLSAADFLAILESCLSNFTFYVGSISAHETTPRQARSTSNPRGQSNMTTSNAPTVHNDSVANPIVNPLAFYTGPSPFSSMFTSPPGFEYQPISLK
ncbi:hypothetical protein Tco_0872047 [Tanacetum coccineum]